MVPSDRIQGIGEKKQSDIALDWKKFDLSHKHRCEIMTSMYEKPLILVRIQTEKLHHRFHPSLGSFLVLLHAVAWYCKPESLFS